MRDRFGDTHPPQEPHDQPQHNPNCRKGWLGEDLDGRPIPCLQCRPNLANPTKVYGVR